ncbi:MAG TPA: cation:proton antiporter [Pseudonocardiaceae bacterium]|nr:cation:proton antiporter [Pseudonocardiaceae bacterium]
MSTTVREAPATANRKLARSGLAYLAMVLLPLALAVLLLRIGAGDDHSAPAHHTATAPDPLPKLLFALPVIFLTCRLLSGAARKLWQPAVIGEIFAGVLLVPSFLGWVWPAAYAWIFPAYLTSTINTLSQIGLVLFMFLVGYELDIELVRRRTRAAVLVSHASIAVPFLSGIVLAIALHGSLGAGVGRLPFALFIAVSMSVTAFPVLARIITDRGMNKQPIAALALSCAAINDITAWCLLALVTAIASATSIAASGWTVVLTVAFFAFMLTVVRPLLRRLFAPKDSGQRALPETAVLAVLLAGLLLSSLATNEIGIHPIFGAFVFGVITPRGSLPVNRATGQMHGLTVTLLLPLFFVYTGLRTKFGLLGASWSLWGWCLLIIVLAMLGKLGGSLVAARLSGIDRRDSWSVGVLMNCRGLTELVVLNIGLDLKIISPTLFTMLVIMTLVSTVATSPALSVIERWRPNSMATSAAEPVAAE